MVSKPIVYGTQTSPTVKAVLLTLKALNVDYEFRNVLPNRGEQLKEDYLRKNPAHTIPTLEDEPGKYIGDSHAIMAYLVGKYGTDDQLYPKDLYQRAKVDEILHFENGMFITCVKQTLGPIFARERNDVPPEKVEKIIEAYGVLEKFFGDHRFLAGGVMTIADFSCLCSVSSMYVVKPIDEEKYPKLIAWLECMMSLPYYEEVMENEASMATAKFLERKLAKL